MPNSAPESSISGGGGTKSAPKFNSFWGHFGASATGLDFCSFWNRFSNHLGSLLGRPGRPQRVLREASKRLFEAFCVEDAIGNKFWSRFRPEKEALGRHKSMNFVTSPADFVISPFSARVASGVPFWTLPGSVFGASWPPR